MRALCSRGSHEYIVTRLRVRYVPQTAADLALREDRAGAEADGTDTTAREEGIREGMMPPLPPQLPSSMGQAGEQGEDEEEHSKPPHSRTEEAGARGGEERTTGQHIAPLKHRPLLLLSPPLLSPPPRLPSPPLLLYLTRRQLLSPHLRPPPLPPTMGMARRGGGGGTEGPPKAPLRRTGPPARKELRPSRRLLHRSCHQLQCLSPRRVCGPNSSPNNLPTNNNSLSNDLDDAAAEADPAAVSAPAVTAPAVTAPAVTAPAVTAPAAPKLQRSYSEVVAGKTTSE